MLPSLIRWRSANQPHQNAVVFLADGETRECGLSYRDLEDRSGSFAAALAARIASGERVVLVYPAGLEFVVAFLGCLRAAVVPVPAYPPAQHRLNDGHLVHFRAIVDDSEAVAVIGPRRYLTRDPLRTICIERPLTRIAHEHLLGSPRSADERSVGLDDIAYLQYTSGSTRSPKGVVIPHRSLMEQLAMYRQRAGADWQKAVMVAWLPHDHDFGLVGFLLSALFMGVPCYVMSPTAFAQKPLRWLAAISRYGGTYSGGPNFAYDLCVNAAADLPASLDLSCWTIASVGGEPVNARTLDRFARRFEPHGFRRTAFLPAYGLAEAVLSVVARQGVRAQAFDAHALRDGLAVPVESSGADASCLVSCGTPLSGQDIAIVDPDSTEPCASDQVGEIWVSGSSIADGYWHRREETETTFRARPRNGDQGPYLRTGDLGFLHDGELFVTGRLTDLLVVRGQNHSAEDIEWTAQEAVPALAPGAGCAFLVGDDQLLHLVHEWKPDIVARTDEAAAAIRQAIAERHGLIVHAIVFIQSRTLPRTTSGKVRRDACRDALAAGNLRVIASHPLRTDSASGPLSARDADSAAARTRSPAIESQLTEICQALLPGTPIDIGANFFEVGIDSLAAHQILARVRTVFGIEVPVRALFDNPTIAQLAAHIRAARSTSSSANGMAGVATSKREPARDRQAVTEWSDIGPVILQRLDTLTELVARQAEMLRALSGSGLLIQHDARTSAVPPIPGVSPLSAGQRETLFLSQLAAGRDAAFNVIGVVRFHEPPDGDALQRAFRKIAARHDALRTVLQPDEQSQRVLPTLEPDVSLENLAQTTGDPDAFLAWLRTERGREFDLQRGPLWRVRLVRLDRERCVLVVAANHVIADGWSLHTLLREFEEIYVAERDGDVFLRRQPMQFADFRSAQQLRRDATRKVDEEYWRRQFQDGIPVVDLPVDHPRPEGLDDRAACVSIVLDVATARRVQVFAAAHRCTVFVALVSCYLAFLQRLTGQPSLAIAVDAAGRSFDGSEEVIGACGVVLPIVGKSDGNPTVSEYVEAVRERVWRAFEHQDFTLTDLLESLKTPVDPRRAMRIGVSFNMLPAARAGRLFAPDLDLAARSLTHSAFDLTVNATETAQGIRLDFVYSVALFRPASIERFATYYENLLAAMHDGPELPIFAMPFLPSQERAQLAAWSASGAAYADSPSFVQRFEAQVGSNPQARAVVGDGNEASYAQLNARANAIAWELLGRGIERGSIVALHASRDIDYLAAVLGIFKAGAVYFPLDPRDPDDRMREVLARSGAAAVLAGDETLLASILSANPSPSKPQIVPLRPAAAAREDNPGPRDDPGAAAYVINTSGSTGKPAGAIVSHRGMLNHLSAKVDALALTAADRVAQTATQCFDISVWQFLAPLMAGGEVHVFGDAVTHDPARLLLEIDRTGITIAQVVPAALQRMLADSTAAASLRQLRWMIATGEALPPGLCRRWLSRFPDVPLLNAYGPTECSDDVTHHCLIWPPDAAAIRVPIGKPIRGANLYVLDPWLQPAPPGMPGELYVGGPCVGLGYLRDEERTARFFLPDPFSTQLGARLYRTGDRVQYGADGTLDFLGRSDRQEQVEGVRIEPQEIESVLALHPTVRECAVVVRRGTRDAELAGYVVFRDGYSSSIGELRFFLRRRLPVYMIPATITVLDALPLMPSGKIDRRALPDPMARAGDRAQPIAPQTPLEQDLVAIWSEVLQQSSIGIHDDLFERGGRSLDAVRVASLIAAKLQVKLPIAQVYREPTVAGIAQYLRTRVDAAPAPHP
jgi:amino acid adenylation domain-containing protein